MSRNNAFRLTALLAFTFLIALTWGGDMEVWRKIALTVLFVFAVSDKVIIRNKEK